MKFISLILFPIIFSSCTMYTEKRSEALSQAVVATSDSIDAARFDLAEHYSKEAVKLAKPPKKKIQIEPIITTKTFDSINNISNDEKKPVMRLVVPETLRHTELLIENSNEWNELLKIKEFSKQIERDKKNLLVLKSNVDKELQKQNEMKNKMVADLNKMQKELIKKDLAIIRRNIVIVTLIVLIGAGLYLRIKGVL
jgi:hypothetical protein